MKNKLQDGRVITVTAPAQVASGDFVAIGALRGVAVSDAASGASVAIETEGVFALPKEATTATFSAGDEVEWDGANSRIAALSTGARIGVVVADAAATDATASVRLTP